MSIFSKLFKKKGTKQIELKVEELPNWVKTRAKETLASIEAELKEQFKKISSKSSQISINLDKLEKAELQNPKMITRAKQIMAGNRESYIMKVEQFLEQIEIPEEFTLESVKEFLENYDRAIKYLTKSSAKSYYIVSEFFGNEISAVARNIKDIDNQIKMINVFLNERGDNIIKINETLEMASNIKGNEKRIEMIKQEISELEQQQNSVDSDLEKTKLKISKTKSNKSFKNYNKHLEDEVYKKGQLQKLESELNLDFSVLDRALRKYSKITLKQGLVDSYLENAVHMLLKDHEYEISSLLTQLKSAIENGEVELKDKKKTKSLEQINKLSRDYLLAFKTNHKKFSEGLAQTKDLIKGNSANLEIKEMEYKVEYLETRAENFVKKKEKAESDLEKLDLNKLISTIKDNIKEVFDVEITNL